VTATSSVCRPRTACGGNDDLVAALVPGFVTSGNLSLTRGKCDEAEDSECDQGEDKRNP
jgi:hypothetical protein